MSVESEEKRREERSRKATRGKMKKGFETRENVREETKSGEWDEKLRRDGRDGKKGREIEGVEGKIKEQGEDCY